MGNENNNAKSEEVMKNNSKNLGRILRQQRLMIPMTLRELAIKSGISMSHLGRIEKGERFPSASVLQKLAGPLGFEESELFYLAGFLSPPPSGIAEQGPVYTSYNLDPYVGKVLSQEPVEVQRIVLAVLGILKSIAKIHK